MNSDFDFKRKRYTVSLHSCGDESHFDLFLESDGVLQAWRITAPPESGKVRAERMNDHRIAYLDYEGEISGSRGFVSIHSTGTYRFNGTLLTLSGGKSAGVYVFAHGILMDARKLKLR